MYTWSPLTRCMFQSSRVCPPPHFSASLHGASPDPQGCSSSLRLLPHQDVQPSPQGPRETRYVMSHDQTICCHGDVSRPGLSSLEPPALVKDQLLTKFAERQGEGSHVLTPRMKDKVLSHLFVLALIIDDFSVDCTALQRDLRLTTAK